MLVIHFLRLRVVHREAEFVDHFGPHADPFAEAGGADLFVDLLAQGVMVAAGTFYRFTRDFDLSSPSTAAGVLLGRTANGRIEWKDAAGKTLREIQEEEAGG